ncbi:hypothetical protein ACVWWQ_002007 [Rhodanobacter sp. TND4EL1]
MMHPQTQPAAPRLPIAALIEGPATTPDEVDENRVPHADYNLQPLRVPALDHYLNTTDKDERFFVR